MMAVKIAAVLVGIVLLITAFLFGMKLHDGPLAIITGGPFKTGQPAAAPDDWTYLTDRLEIEFQTMTPDTSRIVWLGVYDKRLYVVSGYMNTVYGKIWKQWPHYLVADDRVVLRIDGNLYEQRMVRLMDHPQLLEIMTAHGRKYGTISEDVTAEQLRQGLTSGDFWLFEVVDREAGDNENNSQPR